MTGRRFEAEQVKLQKAAKVGQAAQGITGPDRAIEVAEDHPCQVDIRRTQRLEHLRR